jgi:hypothetical protein
MQKLVASLPAAMAYMSMPDLVIDFANDTCFQLVGDRGLLGRPLSEALPELAADGEEEMLARVMGTTECAAPAPSRRMTRSTCTATGTGYRSWSAER